MASEAIPCMPLTQVTDGPLFGAKPGTMSALTNFRLVPGDKGNYAEMRGGIDKLKPSGGSITDFISAGGYATAQQVVSNFGMMRFATAGGVYTNNLQLYSAWYPFGGIPAVGNTFEIGADAPFSRVTMCEKAGLAAPGDMTFAYEYWNGASFTSFTMEEVPLWLGVGVESMSWRMPSATPWVPSTRGDVATGRMYKYWMRVRIVTAPTPTNITLMWAQGNWIGQSELYVATHAPITGGANGFLKRYDVNGTVAEGFSVSATLFSGAASPPRTAAYRGRVFLVNGKEMKKWDGFSLSNIGLPVFAATLATNGPGAGIGIGAGIWRYYVAWGFGPIFKNEIFSVRDDVQTNYGVGQVKLCVPATGADPADPNSSLTTGVNSINTVTITGTMPLEATAAYIFRTRDLTNVPVGKRSEHPAFMVGVLWRTNEGTAIAGPPNLLINLGVFTDAYPEPIFPAREAFTYDTVPPPRQKYISVHQNRLFVGDDEYWFWSDPFTPDVFSNKATNYIALAKSTGGRHMGGCEFADSMIFHTEDQTWGYTNFDLDIPTQFNVSYGVGSVAPDATATGDGHMVQMGRDGFYAWDGGPTGLRKISKKMDRTFGRFSFETHGGSKGIIVDRIYKVRFSDPTFQSLGTAWEYNFDSEEWNQITPTGFNSTLFPLAAIKAPPGTADAGRMHGLWAKRAYTAAETDYSIYLDESTTQDNGNNFNASGTMHFPLPANKMFKPKRILGYYQATDGWGTPSFLDASTLKIGSDTGAWNTGMPDSGDDYSLVGGTPTGQSAGSSDLQFTFSVNSAANGTVNGQRFFGAILEGQSAGIRRGAV